MILQQIVLKNYKQYTDFSLNFREGLVGVVGRNGAGKSTIFDAIFYCLFGTDSDKKELIKNTFAAEKDNVELELSFEIGQQAYRVRREFRGKSLKASAVLFRNEETQIASDVGSVNAEMIKLLGMDKDTFKRSVFSGQKELSELSNAAGSVRQSMIQKIMGLERLGKMQKLMTEDRKRLEIEAKGQRESLLKAEEIVTKEERINFLAKEIAMFLVRQKVVETDLLLAEKAQNQLKNDFELEDKKLQAKNEEEKKLAKYETTVVGLEENLEKLNAERQNLVLLKETCRAAESSAAQYLKDKNELIALDIIVTKIAEKDKLLALMEVEEKNFLAAKQMVESCTEKLQQQTILRTTLNNLDKNIEEKKEFVTKNSEQISQIEQQINQLKGQIKERNAKLAQLQKLGTDTDCPTCFRPLKEMYEATIQSISEEILDYEKTITSQFDTQKDNLSKIKQKLDVELFAFLSEQKETEKQLNELKHFENQLIIEKRKSAEAEENIAKLEIKVAHIGQVNVNKSQVEVLKNQVKIGEPSYLQFLKDSDRVEKDAPKNEQSMVETATRIVNGKEFIKNTKSDILKIDFSESLYAQLKVAKEVSDRQVQQAQKVIYEYKSEVVRAESEQKGLQADLERHQQIGLKIEVKQLEINTIAKLAIFVTDFKNNILERITPTISKEASFLFSKITKGSYESIRVDEDYEFWILDGDKEYPLRRFSGGEVDLANLCLRIALTKAIGELSGSNLMNFLAFDEIFGSQDLERSQEIVAALVSLQEQFRQIYIISHVENVKDLFPNVLQVARRGISSHALWLD